MNEPESNRRRPHSGFRPVFLRFFSTELLGLCVTKDSGHPYPGCDLVIQLDPSLILKPRLVLLGRLHAIAIEAGRPARSVYIDVSGPRGRAHSQLRQGLAYVLTSALEVPILMGHPDEPLGEAPRVPLPPNVQRLAPWAPGDG